jgi:hypothetical protein
MRPSILGLVALAAAALLTVASTIVTARARAPQMPRWEHTCITGNLNLNRVDTVLRDLQGQMNKLGADGWELVTMTSLPGRELFCFKRQDQK